MLPRVLRDSHPANLQQKATRLAHTMLRVATKTAQVRVPCLRWHKRLPMCSSGTDADTVKALEYYKIAANRGWADAFAM